MTIKEIIKSIRKKRQQHLTLRLKTVEISGQVREIKCKWTREMAEDLKPFQGIDESLIKK